MRVPAFISQEERLKIFQRAVAKALDSDRSTIDIVALAHEAKKYEDTIIFYQAGKATICIFGPGYTGIALCSEEDQAKQDPIFAQRLAFRRACFASLGFDTNPGGAQDDHFAMQMRQRHKPVCCLCAGKGRTQPAVPNNLRDLLPDKGAPSEGKTEPFEGCVNGSLCHGLSGKHHPWPCGATIGIFTCTRSCNHTGPHVSCGYELHNYAIEGQS